MMHNATSTRVVENEKQFGDLILNRNRLFPVLILESVQIGSRDAPC